MTCTEFKEKVLKLVKLSNEAEKKRYLNISNKQLKVADVHVKHIFTDKEVVQGWLKFNKSQAEWEAYQRQSRHNARSLRYKPFTDYSDLAYNGVADDF